MSWANFNESTFLPEHETELSLKTMVSYGIPHELRLAMIEAYATDYLQSPWWWSLKFIIDQRWPSFSVNNFNPAGRLEATKNAVRRSPWNTEMVRKNNEVFSLVEAVNHSLPISQGDSIRGMLFAVKIYYMKVIKCLPIAGIHRQLHPRSC